MVLIMQETVIVRQRLVFWRPLADKEPNFGSKKGAEQKD